MSPAEMRGLFVQCVQCVQCVRHQIFYFILSMSPSACVDGSKNILFHFLNGSACA